VFVILQEEHEKLKGTWREKESDSDSNSSATKVYENVYLLLGLNNL
jgi:hypothetical protein